jgi:quinoprotein glucose dehydrogenase
MQKMSFASWIRRAGAALLVFGFAFAAAAAELGKSSAGVAAASDEGELAIKRFKVAPGLKVDLWAAEPLLANPVAIAVDEKGRWYVAETFRHSDGVLDIRGHMNWLEQELAAKTIEDRLAILKGDPKIDLKKLSAQTDRVRLIWDSTGSGRADKATVFAEGFNDPLDGIGAGLLARKGSVYFTCIPDLWLLQDTKGTGVADVKKSLSRGYGVRTAFLGHDLHGLRIGPDGKLYFTVGDRGANITAIDGKKISNPETGAAFRCNLDGSDLEIFCLGLRNPQELAFDKFGNLWTCDNNSDAGDPARWAYLVEGADNGWRVGWQFINQPNARGPWLAERLCYPHFEGQAAYIVPPVAILGNGPSGITYYSGTGLPDAYRDHFFVANFSGGPGNSGIFSVSVTPKGAGFEMNKPDQLIWNILTTDVEIGVDGGVYVSDWVNGWGKPGKGRIYRIHDPAVDSSALVRETRKLIADGMDARPIAELAQLVAHADMRVRLEAQFALVEKGADGRAALAQAARANADQLARLHGIWGLGQLAAASLKKSGAADSDSVTALTALLNDNDAEVRAQAA